MWLPRVWWGGPCRLHQGQRMEAGAVVVVGAAVVVAGTGQAPLQAAGRVLEVEAVGLALVLVQVQGRWWLWRVGRAAAARGRGPWWPRGTPL